MGRAWLSTDVDSMGRATYHSNVHA